MKYFKRNLSILAFNVKDYLELRPTIRSNNFASLRTLTFVSSVIFGFLFFLTLVFDFNLGVLNQSIYGINFLVGVLIYFVSPFVVKSIPSSVAVIVYIYVFTLHLFGVCVGVLNAPDHPATSYIVLLFIIPIMFVERPWRFGLFNFLSGLVFLTSSYFVKAPGVFHTDIINFISFYLLGIVCGRYFTQVKIQQLKFIKVVETERDTDNMTGVLTKTAFLREMDRLLKIDSSRGVFVMIDVDNFKQFNDRYGHDFGDLVLKTLGECMNNSFRRSDLLGRFGGDEFFVFIPSTNDTDIALFRAKSLQIHLAGDIKTPDEFDMVTLSIGIANCKGIGETCKSLFKRADEAIYEAKANGKNTIVVK